MRVIIFILLNVLIFNVVSAQRLWKFENLNSINPQELKFKPSQYQVLSLDKDFFDNFSKSVPNEKMNEAEYPVIQLPNPNGDLEDFYIFNCPMMEGGLAKKYPTINTYTAVRVGASYITAKIDYTSYGFHAMVFNGASTYYVDPAYDHVSPYYISYYKKNYPRPLFNSFVCEILDQDINELEQMSELGTNQNKTHGTVKREYRLALACTGEYAVAVAGATPTKADVLAKMVTSINRINGVFEREFAVHLNLISNTDTLIYLDGSTDPYTNNSGSTMLNENQTNINALIGTANYDMGHVFSTGGGGIAQLGCICGSSKARGVTGLSNPQGDAFDIDYVAHEMGHQFGCNHTFDAATGSCSGNRSKSSAYEVGSATTIMGYAGICTTNDIQPHSDDYYHAKSLSAFSTFITTGAGNSCALATNLTTVPPTFTTTSATYNIPYKTPFELTANATGTSANALTYCWEEWDLSGNNSGNNWNDASTLAPFIRSFNPDTSATRVFPVIDSVITQSFWYKGERLADTQRTLRFKNTVRSFNNGLGAFNFMDDSIKLFTYPTTDKTPFAVTYPSNAGTNIHGNDLVTLTWNVNGTDVGSINCANVDIFYSIDGGRTFPYVIKLATPNDGSEEIKVPDVATTKGRFKVKGTGNVFFNISKYDINVDLAWPLSVATTTKNNIVVLPNPAQKNVVVSTANNVACVVTIQNTLGETMFVSPLTSLQHVVEVSTWPKGVYFIHVTDAQNNKGIKKLVVN